MTTLTDLPFIGYLIRTIDQDIKESSFIQAMRNVVERSRTKLVIYGLEKKEQAILQSQPAIVVANHPNEAEVIALIASLPERKDVYLIVNARMLGIVKELDRHLIPVYIEHHNNPYHHNEIMYFLLKTYHPKNTLTPEKEHELNIISIKKAADIVNKGGLVVIFPGRRSVDGHWFSGVGHLLKQISDRKNTYIFQVFSQGTSILDYFRMVPFVGYLLPTITLHYASPLSVGNVWHKDPKKITAYVENIYTEWSQKLLSIS